MPVAILVAASVTLSICLGLRNSLGLFLAPMATDLGITAGTFGLAIAVQNLVWGFAQPVVGALADRIGARPVLAGSAAFYAAGLLSDVAVPRSRPGPRLGRRPSCRHRRRRDGFRRTCLALCRGPCLPPAAAGPWERCQPPGRWAPS